MNLAVCTLLVLLDAGCTDGRRDDGDVATTGEGETVFTSGQDPTNPFFASLGSNARTCATCHGEAAAWSITPEGLALRFAETDGLDPVFRPNDGAIAPTADTSTVDARRVAYRLLLSKGLIRVGLPIPEGAEFTLSAVDDPYKFASERELSLFRRPLPATNLRFVKNIMWDGREGTLASQAHDATIGHAQAMDVATAAVEAAVAFESSIYTAQRSDDVAGDLASDGAGGGPLALVSATGAPAQAGFSLYASWSTAGTTGAMAARRTQIQHGEVLFNTRRLQIRGVAGLPDQRGTCSTCHEASNIGSHATPLLIDIGTSAQNRRTPDLPLYTLLNVTTGQTVRTSDPGVALITGKWGDIGKFKIPSLRALPMRAPYFHDGQARTLEDVLRFYEQRFEMDLSGDDRRDLIEFLSAL